MEEETNLQLRVSCSKHPLCGMVCVWDLRNSKDHKVLGRGRSSPWGSPANEDTPREECKRTCLFFNTPLL